MNVYCVFSSPHTHTHTSKCLFLISFTWWLGWGSECILSRSYLERLILNFSCSQGSGNLFLLSIELLIYSKEMKMFISVISCTWGHRHRLHLCWLHLLIYWLVAFALLPLWACFFWIAIFYKEKVFSISLLYTVEQWPAHCDLYTFTKFRCKNLP